MDNNIKDLFRASQKSRAVHQKNAIILTEYYKRVSSE